MEFMAGRVNDAILEAARSPVDNPELKAVYVMRWDAERTMLDAVQNYMAETLRLKSEILEETRQAEANR